jgi:hypothetical protein
VARPGSAPRRHLEAGHAERAGRLLELGERARKRLEGVQRPVREQPSGVRRPGADVRAHVEDHRMRPEGACDGAQQARLAVDPVVVEVLAAQRTARFEQDARGGVSRRVQRT